MKKRASDRRPSQGMPGPAPAVAGSGWNPLIMGGIVALAVGLGAALAWYRAGSGRPAETRSAVEGPLTFHRDIAPIIFRHCSTCHHPGEAAPFHLLSYGDVSKRAEQIAEVTNRRLMPPWLPEPGYREFVGQRFLSDEEIQRIQRWTEQGTPEGDPKDGPPPPRWREGWQLGAPDLVVQLPQPYNLAADGVDVYRNFVISIPLAAPRYVRAVEFLPGNARAIHHAFMLIDATRDSRRRDQQDAEPGFPGLHTPPSAQTPPGHFLSWQPGKLPTADAGETAWLLPRNCDLVLQMHLRPSGKPELVQPSVGFYFHDRPGTQTLFKFGLMTYGLDIPAGEANHIVRDSYVLPVDVDVLKVLPHAHYLGRRLEALATLPDGTQQWLFRIPNWDFNWQGDYAYQKPLSLPKGATISMIYSYDNSTNNTRNPSQPPRHVRYGLSSTDEMAELWLQVLPRGSNALATLENDFRPRVLSNAITYNTYLLRLDPDNPRAHTEMGRATLFLGRHDEAQAHLHRAIQLEPNADEAHYALGLLFRMQNRFPEAKAEFQAALRANPDHAKAYGNLGLILLDQGQLDDAQLHFESALRINPDDTIARESLEQIARTRASR